MFNRGVSRSVYTLLVAVFLTSCGGGGSSSAPPPLVNQQPLIFSNSSASVFVDESSYSNVVSGGSGTGNIVYSSSNTDVATVNSTSGNVNILSAGNVSITAVKAQDSTYNSVTASYTLTISLLEQSALTFQSSSVDLFIDESPYTNSLSGGDGTGAVTYSSSDDNIALVDTSTGEVDIQTAGTVTITATKAKDSTYNSLSENYDITIVLYNQAPLVFSKAEVSAVINGPLIDNLFSGGSGSGDISYSSSDDTIAQVNSVSGLVTGLTPGMAIITVTKVSDDLFNEVMGTYDVNVIEIISGFDVSVTATDAEITWQGQSGIIDIFRSTDIDCDVDNYISCADSDFDIANFSPEPPFVDNFIKIDTSAFLVLQNDLYRSEPVSIDAVIPPVSQRGREQMISFKGKLWIIGGYDKNAVGGTETHWYNEIWSSEDGKVWTLENANPSFSKRADHKVVVYDDDLYLLGGEEGIGVNGASSRKFDVWKSSDGVLWEQLNASAPFSGGDTGEVIVFNDKIWMIGGGWSTNRSNIWSSTNGIDWIEEVQTAPFGVRSRHSLYIVNDKLMLLGGQGAGGSSDLKSDVWSTLDGLSWTLESAATSFAPRVRSTVKELNGTYWLVGGHSYGSAYNTVYSSTDGISWTFENADIIIQMYQDHSLEIFNNQLWLYSGVFGDARYMWRSQNGIDWRVPVSTSLEWDYKP